MIHKFWKYFESRIRCGRITYMFYMQWIRNIATVCPRITHDIHYSNPSINTVNGSCMFGMLIESVLIKVKNKGLHWRFWASVAKLVLWQLMILLPCTLTHTSYIPMGAINFYMQKHFLHSVIRSLQLLTW